MRNVEGGVGGEADAHGESEIGGRNGGDRIGPWFLLLMMNVSSSSAKNWNWYMPTRLSTLTLSGLI